MLVAQEEMVARWAGTAIVRSADEADDASWSSIAREHNANGGLSQRI